MSIINIFENIRKVTMNKSFVKEITDMDIDFAKWYTDIVKKTEMVDYGPVKGTMVIRPYGYEVWELIRHELDSRFKKIGVKNAYFPLFIPYSFLLKEAEHVEGFAPEVAIVTHVGETELSEKLVVRPTSETIICDMYSKWINSYRDLPVLINQWANVVRMEKTTRPFLRTSEFLWQEGHTAHATADEANADARKMLELYKKFAEEVLAIPVLIGVKSEKEKFAGAKHTYSMEAMMLDGKSLQAGTTHDLSNNFAKPFNIQYLSRDNVMEYVYQASWGVSTRLIGGLIMAHGDNRGLALPPKVAPIQAVIIPIAEHKGGVMEKAEELREMLLESGIRVELDKSDNSAGWKFNEYEMKGVPLRIEIGPRDVENNCVVVSRRDKVGKENKLFINHSELVQQTKELLEDIQINMLEKARLFRDEHIVDCSSVEELLEAVDNKNFVRAMWCGSPECEAKIKERTSASSRVMPFDQTSIGDNCICCGKKAEKLIYFARAY